MSVRIKWQLDAKLRARAMTTSGWLYSPQSGHFDHIARESSNKRYPSNYSRSQPRIRPSRKESDFDARIYHAKGSCALQLEKGIKEVFQDFHSHHLQSTSSFSIFRQIWHFRIFSLQSASSPRLLPPRTTLQALAPKVLAMSWRSCTQTSCSLETRQTTQLRLHITGKRELTWSRFVFFSRPMRIKLPVRLPFSTSTKLSLRCVVEDI